MMGFKFEDEGAALEGAKGMFDAGVFVVWANNDRSVVQFLPPLILTDDETDELIDRVRGVF
jgi:acetylornithine aminotransferase/putrescine aminotransferase